jgi:YidC/Oxa1 family membrane protein insertase
MSGLTTLFDTILYNPLLNGLIWLYHTIPGHDLGVAIILLTLATKAILAIPSAHAIRSQRELQLLQPKLEALKAQYAGKREELGRKLMEFYKEHKVNPFSSCLPSLIQFPILFILYHVFINGLSIDPGSGLLVTKTLNHLYGPLRSVYSTTPIDLTAFGFLHLAGTKNLILALVTAGLQFWQSRMLVSRRAAVNGNGAKDENMAASVSKQMLYLFPLFTGYLVYVFPAGLGLYWFTSTVFQIVQQYFVFRRMTSKSAANATPVLPPAQT